MLISVGLEGLLLVVEAKAPSATARKVLKCLSSRPPSSEDLAAGVEAPESENDANVEIGGPPCGGAEETWITIVGGFVVGGGSAAPAAAPAGAFAAASASRAVVGDVGALVGDAATRTS